MKLLSKITFVLLVLFVFSCKQEQPEVKTIETAGETAVKQMDPNASYAKAEFTIDGMTCAIGCAKTIETKLAGMEGVQTATVDFDKKLAMVVYNEAKVSPETLTETVTKAGEAYKVSNMKTEGYTAGTAEKKACKPDCKKEGCNKGAKAEASTTEGKKMACKEDCKMPCCANKA
ncbi:MAG: heavy-metal-associated domain-containing protein [Mangrovimonas sp.]|nr:heavy-metal-associated domain-containing protein [Mangrovimonas sp.]